MTFDEWNEANPPTLPFNLIVDLTMGGDCHAKPDPQLHEALGQVIEHVRRETFLALSSEEHSHKEGT